MVRPVNADYYINVGIKDGEVVHVDWIDILIHEQVLDGERSIKKRVKKYLKESARFVVK